LIEIASIRTRISSPPGTGVSKSIYSKQLGLFVGNASYTAIAFISDYPLKFFKIALVSIIFNITINFPTLDASVNGGLFKIDPRSYQPKPEGRFSR
jgi:hypothetical protein